MYKAFTDKKNQFQNFCHWKSISNFLSTTLCSQCSSFCKFTFIIFRSHLESNKKSSSFDWLEYQYTPEKYACQFGARSIFTMGEPFNPQSIVNGTKNIYTVLFIWNWFRSVFVTSRMLQKWMVRSCICFQKHFILTENLTFYAKVEAQTLTKKNCKRSLLRSESSTISCEQLVWWVCCRC